MGKKAFHTLNSFRVTVIESVGRKHLRNFQVNDVHAVIYPFSFCVLKSFLFSKQNNFLCSKNCFGKFEYQKQKVEDSTYFHHIARTLLILPKIMSDIELANQCMRYLESSVILTKEHLNSRQVRLQLLQFKTLAT